jgi:hypothetical protein
VELHRPAAGLVVLDRHHDAVRGGRRHREAAKDLVLPGVQRVVAGGGELRRQAGQQLPAVDHHLSRLAVSGLGKQRQFSPGVLHHGLQAEAHAEHRQPPLVELGEQLVAPEVRGPPGPGREHDEIRGERVQHRRGKTDPQRGDLRAVLAEIVAQGVHERVLMVNDYHPGGAIPPKPCFPGGTIPPKPPLLMGGTHPPMPPWGALPGPELIDLLESL